MHEHTFCNGYRPAFYFPRILSYRLRKLKILGHGNENVRIANDKMATMAP